MMIKNRQNILIWILALLPLAATLYLYPSLPEQLPTSWGFDGQINEYSPKWMAFLLASIPLLINGMFFVLPNIDPKKKNYKKFDHTYHVVRITFVLCMIAFYFISLYAAFHPTSSIVSVAVPLMVAALFILLGNNMPKFKHNYFLGIRTPWTLANEEVWRRTHRLGGFCFILLGIFMGLSPLVPVALRDVLMVILLFATILPLTIYSYFCFRKLEGDEQEA